MAYKKKSSNFLISSIKKLLSSTQGFSIILAITMLFVSFVVFRMKNLEQDWLWMQDATTEPTELVVCQEVRYYVFGLDECIPLGIQHEIVKDVSGIHELGYT